MMPEASMLIVGSDPGRVETELWSGRLSCPGCGGRLAPWGHARQRPIRFADGEVDRSPCGSGTSSRLALLVDDGTLRDGEVLTHDSIIGTTFRGRVVDNVVDAGRAAVVTEISGMAYPTGEHAFVLDDRDPVGRGFVLR